MSSEDEQERNQKHKEHKINKKLKKERKVKKDRKKEKSLKKKAYDLIRDSKRAEFFAQKYKNKPKPEGSLSSSQRESRSSSPKSQSSNQKNNQKPQSDQLPIKNQQPSSTQLPRRPIGPERPPIQGVYSKITQQQEMEKPQPQKDDSEFDNFLSGIFGGGSKSKLKNFLDNRVKEPAPKTASNPNIVYLGGTVKDVDQNALHQYMQEWDTQNRGKSLLEIHREKLQQSGKVVKTKERKMFDRDSDLQPFQQVGKQALNQMRMAGGQLQSKFSSGRVENQFT